MEAIGPNIPWTLSQVMGGKSFQLQNDLDRMFSRRDGHRGEPDALTAQVRFWEGARLNRPSPSFMLSLEERARSTHPKSPNSRFLMVALLRRLDECRRYVEHRWKSLMKCLLTLSLALLIVQTVYSDDLAKKRLPPKIEPMYVSETPGYPLLVFGLEASRVCLDRG